MKFTINLPYAEYPVNAVKRVVMVPVNAVHGAATHVTDATTEKAVEVILSSEKGQQMLAEKLLAGLQAAAKGGEKCDA